MAHKIETTNPDWPYQLRDALESVTPGGWIVCPNEAMVFMALDRAARTGKTIRVALRGSPLEQAAHAALVEAWKSDQETSLAGYPRNPNW